MSSDKSDLPLYLTALYLQAIHKAKAEVQAFALGIIHWVDGVKAAFESGNGGQFTEATMKNLDSMRCVFTLYRCGAHSMIQLCLSALIDEICEWATARLVRLIFFFYLSMNLNEILCGH